jgi:2TM domain
MSRSLPSDDSGGSPDQDAKLLRVRRRVAAIKDFYIHGCVFTLVTLGLGAINFAAGGTWWVLWVLLGWGIGVLAHGVAVFGHGSKRMAEWEERKIKQLMQER